MGFARACLEDRVRRAMLSPKRVAIPESCRTTYPSLLSLR
jgi:hypothetical protein